jgi:hypothetical protein
LKLDRKRLVIIVLLIAYFIGITWALLSWSGTVNVDITDDASFHVTNQDGTLELTSPHTESVTSTGFVSYTYRIYNDGNTDIQVAISETDNLPVGTSASWDTTFPVTITMGSFVTATLTIGATQSGSGSYAWTLTSSAA